MDISVRLAILLSLCAFVVVAAATIFWAYGGFDRLEDLNAQRAWALHTRLAKPEHDAQPGADHPPPSGPTDPGKRHSGGVA
jgi:hypothetical protein